MGTSAKKSLLITEMSMGIFSKVRRQYFFFFSFNWRKKTIESWGHSGRYLEDLDLSHHQKDTATSRTLPGPSVKLRPTRSLKQHNLTQLKLCKPLNTVLLLHGLPEWIPGSACAELICAYLPKALTLHEEQLYKLAS